MLLEDIKFYIYLLLLLAILVGVYLLYKELRKEVLKQQEHLKLQEQALLLIREEIAGTKEELKRSNDEVQYNRMVPVIYSQLKRFEEAIQDFTFEALSGKDGINYLLAKINLKQTEIFDKNKFTSEAEFQSVQAFELKRLIATEQVSDLSYEGAKNILALKSVLESSSCSQDQINQLRNLFIDNVSTQYFKFITKVLEIGRKRIKSVPDNFTNELFQKEMFLKDKEVVKNFKLILDFKKKELDKLNRAHDED